jgi:hypothetical protein
MKNWYVILLIICISCGQKVNKNPPINFGTSQLEVIDTVSHDFPYFKFASTFNNKLLGYSPWNNDVILFDLETRDLSLFNKFGAGPEEYLLLFNNVGFTGNEEIIIGGIKEIKIFDPRGNFLRDLPLKRESTHAPVLKPFGIGNTIYGINLPQGSSSNPEFFDNQQELLIKFDVDKRNNEMISGFPFKKLNDQDGYYLHNGLVVSCIEGKKFYLMDQNEPVLRVFDLELEKEEEAVYLNLQYFEPQLLPFGKKFTPEQLKFLSAMNSTLYGIFVEEHLVFVIYDLAYSEDEIQDFFKNMSKNGENNSPPIRYVLHVSDKDGNKIINDVIIPMEFGRPIFACEDYILMLKEGSEKNLLLKLKYS